MAVPKAIQRQIDEADRLAQEAAGVSPVPLAEEAAAVVGSIVPADGAPTNPEEVPATTTIEDAPPVEPPASLEPPVEAPPVDLQPVPEDWEHKYNVLQGKYNAEVPRLNQQVGDLSGQVGGLHDLLAKMQDVQHELAQGASAAPAAQPLTPEQTFNGGGNHITPKDVEDYGEELIDLAKRAAREVADPEIARLAADNAQLREQLGGMNTNLAADARTRMLGQLDGLVENWRDMNKEEGFNAWLEQTDPYVGVRRRDMLQQAVGENNLNRVAAFFNGYTQEHATVSGQAPLAPAPPVVAPQVPLETLAAPGRSRGGEATGGAPQESRIYSQAQISQFYREVQQGKWATRDEDKVRVESDIIAAAREGRIR